MNGLGVGLVGAAQRAMVMTFDTSLAAGEGVALDIDGPFPDPPSAVIDWGDGETTVAGSNGAFSHTYSAAGTYTVTVTGTAALCEPVGDGVAKLATIEQWGDLGLRFVNYAFSGCTNLTSAPNNTHGMETVTDWSGTFENCASLNSDMSGWDMSAVTTLNSMFSGASSFDGDVSTWDTSAVTNMGFMFDGAAAFNRDLSGWNVALIATEPSGFDDGTTAWVLPKPVWGTDGA